MIKAKAILRVPLFLAVGSIIVSTLYLADTEFPIVATIIGKRLDFVGMAALGLSLAGAISGLVLLQIKTKERIVHVGALLSAFGMLFTLVLPL